MDRGWPSAESSMKRRRTPNSLHRRKRAATACQFCRLRKAKCDNVRPVCGFCRDHQAKCRYLEDDAEHELDPYDPVSRDIISRLEEIKVLLKATDGQGSAENASQHLTPPPLGSEPAGGSPLATRSVTTRDAVPIMANGSHTNHKPAQLTATRCEMILKWPIFKEIIPDSDSAIEFFLFHKSLTADEQYHSPASLTPAIPPPNAGSYDSTIYAGIQEEKFVPLCQKFLRVVHARNPILDPQKLLLYAQDMSENGLRWDAPSCLVLIACALACYTTCRPQNSSIHVTPEIPRGERRGLSASDQASGDAYYAAAQKRIGSLEASVIDIQCLFFASVFEKCSLRPLKAWFYIQQACQRLQALLMRSSHFEEDNANMRHPIHHLEQRIFWSCFRAEQELVSEVGLNSSGLHLFDYPDMFPTPPVPLIASSPQQFGPNGEIGGVADEEQSWAFYLVEISLRRAISESILPIYAQGESTWLANPKRLLRCLEDGMEQLRLYREHLPKSIQFSVEAEEFNELAFYSESRFTEWKESLVRPLLYYVVHQSPANNQALDSTLWEKIVQAAQNSIAIQTNLIIHSSHHHRHGGTWFTLRKLFQAAMQILAVVVFDQPETLQAPMNWEELILIALRTLAQWSAEASDVETMRAVLERAFFHVSQIRRSYSAQHRQPNVHR